jgi:hypothetical protein
MDWHPTNLFVLMTIWIAPSSPVKPRSRSGEGLRDLIKLVEQPSTTVLSTTAHMDITQPILRHRWWWSSDRCLIFLPIWVQRVPRSFRAWITMTKHRHTLISFFLNTPSSFWSIFFCSYELWATQHKDCEFKYQHNMLFHHFRSTWFRNALRFFFCRISDRAWSFLFRST